MKLNESFNGIRRIVDFAFVWSEKFQVHVYSD